MNKGKTLAQCLRERTDYAKNPEKTDGGELISVYACDQRTAPSEFFYSKQQYKAITGREQKNDVIAYQVRQSFKPGEVTPEEANRIGYELASRFLKGKHAFIVCTHVDKKHIHNHIIWNSTTLDCKRKFRDFRGSGKAVARLSDLICTEHRLSVIENPTRHGKTYDKWLGNQAEPSHRDNLRAAIDRALAKNPHDFETLLCLLEAEGYTVKRGKHISISHPSFQKNIRLRSLGEGYMEEDLRSVVSGQKTHIPKMRRIAKDKDRPQGIIDIQAKLAAGMGEGYRRWATVENLKRLARTKLYMDEHNLTYDDMAARHDELAAKEKELSDKVQAEQNRLAEVNTLKTQIINYAKTRDVFDGYKKSGYSKAYLEEHESDIIIHRAAKKAFNELGVKKLPTVKSLQSEFSELLTAKKNDYAELRKVREELRELSIHKANYEELRDMAEKEQQKENEQRQWDTRE